MENYNNSIMFDSVVKTIKEYPRVHEAYKYVIKNNPSNQLPYHSIRHILNVFRTAKMFINSAIGMGLSELEKEAIYIAILFHDYGHSGGKFVDEYNVKVAIDEFRMFVNYINYELQPSGFNADLICEVMDNIKCTQYPYVILTDKLSLSQKIVRDSDLLQILKGNILTDYLLPLYDEMIVRKDKNTDLIDFIDDAITFWKDVEFSMDFRLGEVYKEQIILEFEKYKEILK